MAWKGLFQHLKGLLMDDHHEFRCAHMFHIEEWRLYWSHNYVSIIRGFVAIGGVVINPSNTASGSGNLTIESVGIKLSIGARGPLHAFNLVVEFF